MYNSVAGAYATHVVNQSEAGMQSGDWTASISGIRFTSNGKFVSGKYL